MEEGTYSRLTISDYQHRKTNAENGMDWRQKNNRGQDRLLVPQVKWFFRFSVNGKRLMVKGKGILIKEKNNVPRCFLSYTLAHFFIYDVLSSQIF